MTKNWEALLDSNQVLGRTNVFVPKFVISSNCEYIHKNYSMFCPLGLLVWCANARMILHGRNMPGHVPGGHEPGWRTVPAHDPVVQEAANHAVKTIQQRSNSLAPYELLEILLAKAEVGFSCLA